jgi:hypothetical protein
LNISHRSCEIGSPKCENWIWQFRVSFGVGCKIDLSISKS